jgi:hypothetical protein
MRNAHGAILTDRVVETVPLPTVGELAHVAVRGVLVLLTLVFLVLGVAILTTPGSVLFTVALWLCGAAFLGAAVFGRFPD